MNILIGLTAGMSVILAFLLGFLCGIKVPGVQTQSNSTGCSEHSFRTCESNPVPTDEESTQKANEDQKAFIDCMNYSAVQAYERKQP